MVQDSLPVISESIFQEIYKHAEETYPHECCGMLTGPKRGGEITEVRRAENVYDMYRAQDPKQYPRTARTAYLLDPRQLLAVEKESRKSDIRLKVVYHSHADVGAYFSEEDRRTATFEGEPILPGVSYLVISCRAGKSDGAELFHWSNTKKDFVKKTSFSRRPL